MSNVLQFTKPYDPIRDVVKNINVSSRYDIEDEIRTMYNILYDLSPLFLTKLKSIFCDSKATSVFELDFDFKDEQVAILTLMAGQYDIILNTLFFYHNDGHNGVMIKNKGKDINMDLDPNWDEYKSGH